MKQSPQWKEIEELMQPGRLTRDGMLGHDPRSLPEILEADQLAIARLGVTHADITNRLTELTRASQERLGDTVIVEGRYEVRVEDARGIIPCPFRHPGWLPKHTTFLKDLETGEELQWSALSVHMINAHGFYQGRGSTFRIEPEQFVRVLRITPPTKETK